MTLDATKDGKRKFDVAERDGEGGQGARWMGWEDITPDALQPKGEAGGVGV